jgi:hypothetical protein
LHITANNYIMKKFLLLMSLSILLQSCFSYTRALDFNAGEVQVNQDVKIYKNNGTERKGKVLSVDEDQIAIIYSKTKQVLKIPVKDISGVQGSELSVAKSFAIPSAILLAIPIIFILILAAGL